MVKVEIKDFSEGDTGFSVYAIMEGEHGKMELRKGYPKAERYLAEDDEGIPGFVKDLKEVYREEMQKKVEKLGAEGKKVQDYEDSYDV